MNNPDRANKDSSPLGRDEFVTIARVARPQGRKGEVAAALLTDFPERFESRRRLFALDSFGKRHEMKLEHHWLHKGLVVLKFQGVDSIGDAEKLAGWEIQIPIADRAVLEAGSIYVSDLIGCAVFNAGSQIGTISDVRFGAGEAPLLVVKGSKEHLVPLAGEYVETFSLERKRIEMKLPQGMLELDAPLSAEEKQQQRERG